MRKHGMSVFVGLVVVISLALGGALLNTGTAASKTEVTTTALKCVQRAGGSLPAGPGHPSKVWVGTWGCGGVIGFCGDFVLHNPNGAGGTKSLQNMPNLSADKSAVFAQINGTYRLTTSNTTAMKAGYAEWTIIGGSSFNAYDKWASSHGQFPAIRAGAQAMIKRAQLVLGLQMSVHLTPTQVGQSAKDYVQVTGTGGKPVSGITAALANNANATLSQSTTVSNKQGNASFGLTKAGIDAATVTATTSVVNVHYIVSTVPSHGEQHIYAVPKSKIISATASFNMAPQAATVKSVCDTSCNGNAAVSVSYCNPAGAAIYGYFGRVNNALVLSFSVPAGACVTKTVVLHDGDQFHSSYCYQRSGSCFTGEVASGAVFVVKCPPAPDVFFQADCSCTGIKSYQVIANVPANVHVYKVTVKDNDATRINGQVLTNGASNTLNVGTVNSGDTVHVTVTAYDETSGAALRSWSFKANISVS